MHRCQTKKKFYLFTKTLASSPTKRRGRVTSAEKAVDFCCLALAVPIKLQNETMCTRHSVYSAKNCQFINEFVRVDYPLKVGEKQFLDVRKRHKSRESKIKVCYSWFA